SRGYLSRCICAASVHPRQFEHGSLQPNSISVDLLQRPLLRSTDTPDPREGEKVVDKQDGPIAWGDGDSRFKAEGLANTWVLQRELERTTFRQLNAVLYGVDEVNTDFLECGHVADSIGIPTSVMTHSPQPGELPPGQQGNLGKPPRNRQ